MQSLISPPCFILLWSQEFDGSLNSLADAIIIERRSICWTAFLLLASNTVTNIGPVDYIALHHVETQSTIFDREHKGTAAPARKSPVNFPSHPRRASQMCVPLRRGTWSKGGSFSCPPTRRLSHTYMSPRSRSEHVVSLVLILSTRPLPRPHTF